MNSLHIPTLSMIAETAFEAIDDLKREDTEVLLDLHSYSHEKFIRPHRFFRQVLDLADRGIDADAPHWKECESCRQSQP